MNPARVLLLLAGVVLTLAAWVLALGNQFTSLGAVVWLVSIGGWVIGLSQAGIADYRQSCTHIRRFRPRFDGTLAALLLIMAVGAVFRFADLDNLPGEMTRDQAENIVDSRAILAGVTPVYFPNNTGREPFHMYAAALLAQFTGTRIDFFTFKFLSALEGWFTIPVVWWMCRVLLGDERRALGNRVGLLAAGLLAVSYWHVAITRLGLRLALLPLVTALLVGWLAQALRHNRRGDYLLAGLTLGFAQYTYQAARMLPLIVLMAGAARLLRGDRRRTLLNLAALLIAAFAIFVPLFGYWLEYPASFWQRVSGRFVGEVFESAPPGLQYRLEALQTNLRHLADNFVRTALMFHVHGDETWVSNIPGQPALDPISGILFLAGLAVWSVQTMRRQIHLGWLALASLLIMLLPSVLALANPIEVPSATRTGGALPIVYMLAAFPLALAADVFARGAKRPFPRAVVTVGAAALVAGAALINAHLYFNLYRQKYVDAQAPYSLMAEVVRGYVAEGGSSRNLFLVADPSVWSSLSLVMEMDEMRWGNSVYPADNLPSAVDYAARPENPFRLDFAKPLLFLYQTADEDTARKLEDWFPDGETLPAPSDYAAARFAAFRAPALGNDWPARLSRSNRN